MPVKIITTADGSHSLLNDNLNETYHSVHGAIRESQHVFIEHGLQYYSRKYPSSEISILEMGFGTGLNALLTMLAEASRGHTIKYVSIEAYPLEESVWKQLNYIQSLGHTEIFNALHQCEFDRETLITPAFYLLKLNRKIEALDLSDRKYNLIYYDAFAPSKQPELWTFEMLQKVTSTLNDGGVFVTYCAKGQVKRDLNTLGLQVETLSGPPGKKEMVRAIK